MAGDYVGQYGQALRRLSVLDAQRGMYGPQAIGGADTSSPFSAQPATGGAFGAPEQPPQPIAVAPGVMDAQARGGTAAFENVPAPEAPPALGQSQEEKPTSVKDLQEHMPDDQKDAMADQIEQQVGGDLKSAYEKETGEKPKGKSRWDLAFYFAEIALRSMANQDQYDTRSGSLAAATMDTLASRRARAEQRRLEENKTAETRRLEQREDAETLRKEKREDVKDKTKREQALEDDARNHQQALELARLQAKLLKEKGQKTSIQTAEDGTLVLVDLETGDAVDVTKEVTETSPVKGSRGKGTTGGKTTTKKVPVKAKPKNDASGLDQDTILRAIEARAKELKADRKFVRALRDKGMEGTALERAIHDEAEKQVRGSAQELSSGGGKIIDFDTM